MRLFKSKFNEYILLTSLILVISLANYSCDSKGEQVEVETLSLPVTTVKKDSAITTFEYLGAIEGKVNVEIRPQVEGLLDKIHVDEGDFVEKGQLLFSINALPYVERLKNAQAAVEVEKAKLENAKIEMERLQPLIDHEVISEVQMKTAQSNYEVAKASLAQAEALKATSQIDMQFTQIKAPVSGYIGLIPMRVGNLVAKGDDEPVTTLSDISEVYVYFAMSESNYLFYKKMKEDSTARRLNPNVKLILADGTIYSEEGVIDADAGQIDRNTGAITLRAKFDNPDKLLRSGNTGKIILEQIHPDVLMVPQQSITKIQDKNFVFILKADSTVERKEVKINGKAGQNFILNENNISEGTTIIQSGVNKIKDGMKIEAYQQVPTP
ncbi:efflux RND transporter periplasmic adaptor subunit [Cyclobacterium marinum]|uniref:Efflux transporter, RND family, MFP subunit n=1 Tax=Cyclobacterium marinum (strain ATCC 25205 / DSM 745 / LMG 13164 / NCIMB 1802) TaxID=880070 RepID=G0IWB0_CYCMS|nr:efflux RND transporter periplasmic adaptor subunit [Cyclobacterium marinum]AEL27098.1 efflux transporter, RND family, MFP subunit [Cyclobacterium marinum DSM 745]MBI0400340.1 efflux RND transporter periplasmic adaptor subunit [Cyclobacterium marinum]MBR9778066.1 efflux RND transporter periplasmic adaptor subunit [Cytophagales bacterium]|tara:strand:- start:112049 stop:113194 length:1146 start_codon:yes stop_codon:yes gene_type:complete